MASNLDLFHSCHEVSLSSQNKVYLLTSSEILVSHKGTSIVLTNSSISDLLYLPDFKYNLLFVTKMTKEL